MNDSPSLIGPVDLLKAACRRPLIWLLPAVFLSIIAAGVWHWRGDRWEATQSWIVRNQAFGSVSNAGRFPTPDELKAAQDGLHALVNNSNVLIEALRIVGPPAGHSNPKSWPTEKDVADARKVIKLGSSDGGTLGTTEIIQLKVRDPNRLRCVALASAIARQVSLRFHQVSEDKSTRLIAELREAEGLAEVALNEATGRLSLKEHQIGSDLGELRILSESLSNNSDLRQRTIDLENELRAAQTKERAHRQLLDALREAQADPAFLLAMPGSLLDTQPALKKLREGLADVQLRTAQVQSSMTSVHPAVQAALTAETEVRGKLTREVGAAIQSILVDMRVSADHVSALEEKLDDSRMQLTRLAGQRAEYANLVAEVEHRTKLLEQARTELTSAQANQAGARSGGRLIQLDEPETGHEPLGPSTPIIAAIGAVGGLGMGLGFLLLTTPIATSSSRAVALDMPVNGRRRSSEPTVVYRRLSVAAVGMQRPEPDERFPARKGLPLRSDN